MRAILTICALMVVAGCTTTDSRLEATEPALHEWGACVFAAAEYYADRSNEPSASVANAAMVSCSDEELIFREQLFGALPYRRADPLFADMRGRLERDAEALVTLQRSQ